jgi:hypothetical protein
VGGELSGRQIEQLVDELILLVNIIAADPARLALPDHVHRFVALNRSPGRLVLAKALLGLHASFDRSMILLQDIVQILDRPMSAAAAQGSLLFHRGNRRAIEAGLISVDDAGLSMRWIAEQLASTVGLHVTQYFRTTHQFETGDARYSWLNRSIFVAEGRMAPGDVEYKVYRGA